MFSLKYMRKRIRALSDCHATNSNFFFSVYTDAASCIQSLASLFSSSLTHLDFSYVYMRLEEECFSN